MSDRVQQHLRDALADRADVFPYVAATNRLSRIDYKPRYGPRLSARMLGAASVSGTAVIAAVVALITTVGGSPPTAYGWSPAPKALTPAQVRAVAHSLHVRAAGCSGPGGSVVLVDVRGPYTYTLYVRNPDVTICVNGVEGGSGGLPSNDSIPATRTRNVLNTYGTINKHPGVISPYGFVEIGQAGVDVRSVTMLLSTGTKVQASLEHGWYLVWWPAKEGHSKQLIITTSGTSAATGSKTYEIADRNGELPGRCGAGPATNAAQLRAAAKFTQNRQQELLKLTHEHLTPQQQRIELRTWLRQHGYAVPGERPPPGHPRFC
jgi:hypothetical protein